MTLALSAMVTALAVASLAVSLYTYLHAQKLYYAAKVTNRMVREECSVAIEAANLRLQTIASEAPPEILQPQAEPSPATPRPSMNVTRRTQALRLHRKGDSPERIAATLEVPRQEVDLLLKVHKIVLDTL